MTALKKHNEQDFFQRNSNQTMKLLLFDIDGTILTTHIGRQSIDQTLTRLCGRPISSEHVSFSGKTDPQIVQEILLDNGLSAPKAAALIPEVLEAYVETARQTIVPHRIEVLPGVRDLIDHLAAQDTVQLALLTGNLDVTAYLKLEAVGLAGYFPFGAFGSDHADRAELPSIAVRRAYAHTGRSYTGKDIVIIGDSENDVRCGRGVGAFAVAVATGRVSRAALAAQSPDVLLDDLCDRAFFMRNVVNHAG